MRYLARQFLLILTMTLMAVAGCMLFLLHLVTLDPAEWRSLGLLLGFLLPAVALIEYAWLRYSFSSILTWLRLTALTPERNAEVRALAARKLMVFPYHNAGIFVILFIALVMVWSVALLISGVITRHYIFYLLLVALMLTTVCAPFILHFSKVILNPLKLKMAQQGEVGDAGQKPFFFGIRENLVLVMLTLAIFSVTFGSLLTYTQAQRALRKQAMATLGKTLVIANAFISGLPEDVPEFELETIARNIKLGRRSYIFFMRLSDNRIIHNQDSYRISQIKEMARKNFDLLNPQVVLYNQTLNQRYGIGGVYHTRDFASVTTQLNRTFIILILVAFGLASVLAIFYAHEIVSSLRRFMYPVSLIRAGDLTEPVRLLSEDEIGTLAVLLEQMRQSLYNMNVKIRNAANVVLQTAQKLRDGMDEINTSSHDITHSTHELSQGVNRQFEEVWHMATVMNQLKASFTQVTSKANLTAEASKKASVTAVQGSHEIQEIVNQMEEIKSVVTASRLSVAQLQEKTSEIAEAVGLISKISRHTNKLALNAAIEAARSGEAGKGFAVVAEEVRKLAENSATAAQRIEEKVSEILIVAGRVNTTMSKGEEEVANGQQLVVQTNDSFREIVLAFQEANKLSVSIAKETEDQLKNTEQISKIVHDAATVSEITSSTTSGVKDITIKQTDLVEGMSVQIKRMNAMALELQQLVNRYKLKN